MHVLKKWKILFVTTALALLSGCSGLVLKNQSVCSVAGIMAAGMDCVNTIEGAPYEMTLQETLKFLEPDLETERAGAMCMSAEDFNSMKTTIDIACIKLGSACTVEIRTQIAQVKKNLDALGGMSISTEGSKMHSISSVPKKGDVHADVKVVQDQLLSRGFNPKGADGIFGTNTEKAISEFQKSIGLPGGGIIGPKTLEGLSIQVKSTFPATGKAPVTSDLKGRKARHLHPTLRLLLEARVFPNGVVPDCFIRRDLDECVQAVVVGMEALGIREYGGNNRGELVGYIQAVIGPHVADGTGDHWCMSAVQCIVAFIEDYFQKESPVLDSEHCVTTNNAAKKVPGLMSAECRKSVIWNAMHGKGPAGHTGIVRKSYEGNSMDTFEGNTGSGSIRDGDGAYFRNRKKNQNGTLTTIGWVFLYPNGVIPA